MSEKEKLKRLEDALSYHFRDASLLKHALTHPSYSNENGMPKEASNQRLEFLGDAVLELASSSFLYSKEPVLQEGEMTRQRASLVCEASLAYAARNIRLYEYIVLGKGELREGIQMLDSVLSDAMEAVIGAIYLDGGFDEAEAFIRRGILSFVEKRELKKDAKTMLQEFLSREKKVPSYTLLEESGPDHDKFFRIAVMVSGICMGIGEGSSKKRAEQDAAGQALEKLKGESIYQASGSVGGDAFGNGTGQMRVNTAGSLTNGPKAEIPGSGTDGSKADTTGIKLGKPEGDDAGIGTDGAESDEQGQVAGKPKVDTAGQMQADAKADAEGQVPDTCI